MATITFNQYAPGGVFKQISDADARSWHGLRSIRAWWSLRAAAGDLRRADVGSVRTWWDLRSACRRSCIRRTTWPSNRISLKTRRWIDQAPGGAQGEDPGRGKQIAEDKEIATYRGFPREGETSSCSTASAPCATRSRSSLPARRSGPRFAEGVRTEQRRAGLPWPRPRQWRYSVRCRSERQRPRGKIGDGFRVSGQSRPE
jgi:hypothetical protein